MENLVKDLFAHKVERCSQLYTIIQKLFLKKSLCRNKKEPHRNLSGFRK